MEVTPTTGLGKVLAPRMCRSTNRHVDPEVWFRIVHLCQFDHRGAAVAYYREQTVEIALGHKGPIENCFGSATSPTRSR